MNTKPYTPLVPAARLIAVVLLIVAGSSGCTSARTAAEPATLLTLDLLREREAGLQARIDAERKAYVELARVVETAEVQGAKLAFEAKQFIEFTRMADSVLVEKKGLSESALIDFLLEFDDRYDVALVEAAESKVRADARKRTAMQNLARDEAAAATVEEQLMLAAKQRTPEQELKFLIDYGQGVKKQLDRLKELDKLRQKAATQPTSRPAFKPVTRPAD